MKRVYTADNIADAGLVRSFLEQHDIPATLRNEHTSAVIGDLPFVNSYPELWVADDLCGRAAELLLELRQSNNNNTEQWLCAKCQESNPGNFEICWQCSHAR